MRVIPAAAVTVGDGSRGEARPVTDWASPDRASARAIVGSAADRAALVIGKVVVGLPSSTWLLADVCILLVGVYAAFAAFPPPELPTTPHVALWQAAAVFTAAMVVASLIFGLYERETVRSRSRIVTRIGLTCATATVLAYAVIYVIMYATVSRRAAALVMLLFVLGGGGVRFGACWAATRALLGLLVVGSRKLFESFRAAQAEGLLREYRLVGYATPQEDRPQFTDDPDFLGPVSRELDRLMVGGVTEIVVCDTAARDPRVMGWVVPALQRGCRVTNEAIFYEKATGQILVDQITPSWFLFADLKVQCEQQATLKRILDLVLGGVGLVLSAPLWPLIALAVKLCDGGPVFYAQDRVGQHGKVFRLYKFRTMQPNAENGKSVWCAPNDPRVTQVGRLLRRTRLDELPQLFNVLVGHMSVVGPRPERPDIVEHIARTVPFYAERHLVKPGITGWAQISFRYGSSVEDAKRKLQFDLYYLKHMSFELDLIILFRTVGTFLRGAC